MSNLTLDQKLRSIGFRIGFKGEDVDPMINSSLDYDIEETLLLSIYESENDGRILRIVLGWIKVHGDRVLLEKFFKKAKIFEATRGEAFMMPLIIGAAVVYGHIGWKKWLKTNPSKPFYPGSPNVVKSSISHKGANPQFQKIGILIPNGFLGMKEGDVFTIEELVASNVQYKNRYIYGTNWRADIITAIQCGLTNAFQISKKIGCSYEPAYRVSKEYLIATRSQSV